MFEKTDLLDAIAPTGRGLTASSEQKADILAKAARLEDRNPTPAPLQSPHLLNGDWQLLYTTSAELLGIDRVPLIALGDIYQCLRLEQQRVYNFAEISTAGILGALVTVAASFEVVSPKRVNVCFDRAVFGLQGLLGYRSPEQFIRLMAAQEKFNLLQGIDLSLGAQREPGWLEVTYLDSDLRIGRGNQGSLFVLRRRSVL